MNKFQNIDLTNIVRKTEKSIMTPLELKDFIDFEVKRVYFFEALQAVVGQHCHKEEKEFFLMIKGNCTAIIDRGNGLEEIELEEGKNAFYVSNYVWHGFKHFSEHAIILAISSTNYRPDRSDYIENYDEYLKIRDEKLKQE